MFSAVEDCEWNRTGVILLYYILVHDNSVALLTPNFRTALKSTNEARWGKTCILKNFRDNLRHVPLKFGERK